MGLWFGLKERRKKRIDRNCYGQAKDESWLKIQTRGEKRNEEKKQVLQCELATNNHQHLKDEKEQLKYRANEGTNEKHL